MLFFLKAREGSELTIFGRCSSLLPRLYLGLQRNNIRNRGSINRKRIYKSSLGSENQEQEPELANMQTCQGHGGLAGSQRNPKDMCLKDDRVRIYRAISKVRYWKIGSGKANTLYLLCKSDPEWWRRTM